MSIIGLNSEFSFSLVDFYTNACLPYHLPIAVERIVEFISFPRVLALCSGFEHGYLNSLPTTITVTPQAFQLEENILTFDFIFLFWLFCFLQKLELVTKKKTSPLFLSSATIVMV